MPDTVPHLKLTHDAAQRALAAGIAKAQAMGVPQCIAVVDDGGHLRAFVRMDNAKYLSIDSSLRKAMSAANHRRPTGYGEKETEIKLALVTDGRNINLKGGTPIIVDGHCIGGIGVGSGTGEQDEEVSRAAVAAIGGAKTDF